MRAFIPYAIRPEDAHLVYEVGDILSRNGYDVEYNHHASMGQAAYDEVAISLFFVGVITTPAQSKEVIQLWQYAQGQGIPAFLLVEERVSLSHQVGRHKDVQVFSRRMVQNPVRFIELLFGGR
jgi:hypothetical protein